MPSLERFFMQLFCFGFNNHLFENPGVWDCSRTIRLMSHSRTQAPFICASIDAFGLHSNVCQKIPVHCAKSFQLSLHIHAKPTLKTTFFFCLEKAKCPENTFPWQTSILSVSLPTLYQLESTCNQLLLHSSIPLNLVFSCSPYSSIYSSKGGQNASANLTENVYRISCYRAAMLDLTSLWGRQV